ncbi:MAG: GerW family sporulation protein [Firmicutes bacterium]|nr:GerW family sporulation protein [Bacillota bacterium]
MILGRKEHPIEGLMDKALVKIRELVDANTIIGCPVKISDGASIIPVSKLSMGFVAGGGEYSDYSKRDMGFPFAGGSGGGVNVTPIAFLVSDGKSVKLVHMDDKGAVDKMLSLIPDVLGNVLENTIGKKKQ